MKNIYAKAWICVGVMMLGIVILMSSLAFLGNKVMMNICLVLGAIASWRNCFPGRNHP